MAGRRRFNWALKRQAGGQEAPTGVYIARLTAQSAGPHLHFDVTIDCFKWGCQTIKITCSYIGADSLVQGEVYTPIHQYPQINHAIQHLPPPG